MNFKARNMEHFISDALPTVGPQVVDFKSTA